VTIRFPCSTCGRMVEAPDSAAGRKAKCPLCKSVQVVPAAGAAGASGAAPPPPVPPGRTGSLAGDCFKAIGYGLSNFNSIFVLVVYAVVLYGLLSILLQFFRFFLFSTLTGQAILAMLGLAAELIIGGFFLRFYLDAVIGSLEGADQAPNVPEFNPMVLFMTGLKGLGIGFVYVFPVVTIPLLPLGLLGWGYSNDARGFDVFWAVRAAMKRPLQLLILWPILLMWIAVMVVAIILLWMALGAVMAGVAAAGCFGILISLLVGVAGAAVIAAAGVMFTTVQFRCIGMLGRHNPILTEMLPEHRSPARAAGFIIAGIVVSTAIWVSTILILLRK